MSNAPPELGHDLGLGPDGSGVRPDLVAGRPIGPATHSWHRLIPRTLATRTAVGLLASLAIVQAIGLGIHARDHQLTRHALAARYTSIHVMNAFRGVLDTLPDLRHAEIVHLRQSLHFQHLSIDPEADLGGLPPTRPGFAHILRQDLEAVPMPPDQRPADIRTGAERGGHFAFALELPDGTGWLNIRLEAPPPSLLDDPTFATAWIAMTLAAGVLTMLATRRLTAPVRTLAEAADRLGRDVNAPPLPEDGPLEVARAAAAFNLMAERIRRFVQDRTFLLTAIGHDLRTPITRLKLRCEFIDDEDLRTRFLADLDELEQMVSATLAFGRDTARAEPATPLDLGAMLRTVLDDEADARPQHADRIRFTASAAAPVAIRARPIALKRSFANLVGNALSYGGNVCVTLHAQTAHEVIVLVEDDGPGIPPGEMERVFEPFRRLEASRSRETGGFGLGLSIARNIVRAHGGEITLANRAGGGLQARVALPL